MEESNTLARLIMIILIGLVVPQALGIVGYIYALKKNVFFRIGVILISPVFFFVIANLFWNHQAIDIQASGHRLCGAFGAAAAFSILFGTLIHLILGVVIFLTIYLWKKRLVAQRAMHANT